MAHIWTDNVSEGKNHAEMFPGSKCSSFTLRSNSLQIQGMENWIVLAGTLPFPIKSVRMAARVTCRARMIIWWATCLFVISTRTASIAAAAPGDLDRCDENTHDRTCPEPATKSGPSSSSSPSEEVAATTAAKVILDCDPGVDDLLAIWWMIGGHQRGLLELIAITTVAGNVDARLVHRNAVISTYFFPALRSKGLTFGRSGTRDDGSENESDLFYGDDGLGGLTEHLLQASNLSEALLPEYKSTASSPQLLVDLLLKHDMHSITIVAIGPLTNLAQAEKIRPGILSRAREIVIMGGGFGFDGTEDGYNARGNMNALAEFNFWSDAESAAAVMQTGARSSLRSTLTLVPLDVTQQVCWTPEQNKLLKDSIASILLRERNSGDGSRGGDDDGVKMEGGGGANGSEVVNILEKLVRYLDGLMLEWTQRCIYLHDPAAIGYLLYPQLFQLRRLGVRVGVGGDFKGHTWTDTRPQESMQTLRPNAWVASDVHEDDLMMAMRRDFALLAVSHIKDAV